MKNFELNSLDGKHNIKIPVKTNKKHWASRKCWAVHCNNEINVVHLTEHNNADYGYCWWCYRDAVIHNIFWGGKGYTRGRWVTCEKHYKYPYHIYLKTDNTSEQLNKSFYSRFRRIDASKK